MREPLFLVTPEGLTRMRPSAPPDESALQALIARHSDLIDADGLLLVSREQGVADGEGGTGRWSLDHLFVTRDAIPVLVEVKRAVDNRLRREVVGQLLDYAANGSSYWSGADLARTFAAEHGDAAEGLLADFLNEADVTGFWERVEANLRDGRLTMLFVADEIPAELARIVEFLDGQMRCTVRAVELRYFESADGRLTLAPRVIGQTEAARVQKARTAATPLRSIDEWIEYEAKVPFGANAAESVRRWVRVIEKHGARLNVSRSKVGLVAKVDHPSGTKLNALELSGRANGGAVRGTLPFGKLGILAQDVRKNGHDILGQAVGGLSNDNLDGYPSFKAECLLDDALLARFDRAVAQWFALCSGRPR